jgi:hypothetical protein
MSVNIKSAQTISYHTINTHTDLPARGNANGLNSDDLDDDEDYNEEESEELMTMNSMGRNGNRLGGLPTDDSRYQSVLCMYINTIICELYFSIYQKKTKALSTNLMIKMHINETL